ncbi:MAG: hypothetical protein L0L09_10110, partial [Staphylococcus equorum]|nr:hypothetical protein [Staphylococcus equorum]
MAINKIAKLELKDEPYLKPVADFGFGFYNMDVNTATLKIQISRNDAPLLVGENNAIVWGLFQSENKSSTGTQELEIVDAMNGIVQITLDHEFLQASTDTTVNAQVYVAPRNGDDIAALNEFSFKVKDALINQIDAVSKITYIRMFDDLKARIENKVFEIEEAIKNIDDYVVKVESASTQAQKDIALLKDNSIKEIEDKSTSEQDKLDEKIESANTSLTQITDVNIEQVNLAKTEAVQASNDAKTEIESKVAGFKTEDELKEVFMTPEQADAKYLTVQDDDNYATKADVANLVSNDALTENHYTKPYIDENIQTKAETSNQLQDLQSNINNMITEAVNNKLSNVWETIFIGSAMTADTTYDLDVGKKFSDYKTVKFLIDDSYNGAKWYFIDMKQNETTVGIASTNIHNTLATAPVMMEFNFDIS